MFPICVGNKFYEMTSWLFWLPWICHQVPCRPASLPKHLPDVSDYFLSHFLLKSYVFPLCSAAAVNLDIKSGY